MQTLQLPLILERLSPGARSWVIARAAKEGVTPQTVAYGEIEENAERDGFGPGPDSPARQQVKPQSHPKAA